LTYFSVKQRHVLPLQGLARQESAQELFRENGIAPIATSFFDQQALSGNVLANSLKVSFDLCQLFQFRVHTAL
jgi:hypothetical protein